MKKVLVVAPAWLGDMVMAQSLLILLHQQGANIDVLAPEWNFAILKCMPQVIQRIPMPIGHGELKLKARYQLGKSLRENHYQEAYVLPNSYKAALVPFFAKIPKRTGWVGEMRYGILNDYRKLNAAQYPLMVQRFAALAYGENESWASSSYPKPQLSVQAEEVMKTLQQFNVNVDQGPLLALCPGAAFGEAKRWPEAYFAEVAQEKLNQGWQILLLGSPKDLDVSEKINQATQDRCINLTGRLQLNETVDLISSAAIVISNDSGLLHVAAALNIPVIGIYGSTTPDFTPPLSNAVKIMGLDNLSCRPCFKRSCQFGHLKCLREIKPSWVTHAIDELMEEK